MDFLYLFAGLLMLVACGDALVRGAVVLGLRLGISTLLISLTVVAFGTSAPELLVSVQAVMDNAGGLALGNVVGSNTANILFILGIPALMIPISMSSHEEKTNYLFMLGTGIILTALCFRGSLDTLACVIMLATFAAIMAYLSYSAVKGRRAGAKDDDLLEDEINESDTAMSNGRIALMIIGGLVGLILGSDILIKGATGIARDFNISEEVIGLTLVAVGTSLPELGTVVSAARRGHGDVIVGNIIGSNIFNTVGILGIATIFGSIPVAETFLKVDLWVMLAASLMLMPFIYLGKPLGKVGGSILLLGYAVYITMIAQNSL